MSNVNLNMDFSKPLAINTAVMGWVPSYREGVERRPLERENAEGGRATTIVRYAPGSSFSAHTHGGGEEYLVLEGVFSDENGDFGKGHYVRNPPGSSHAPFSEAGCVIFVKLCQMQPEGEPQIHIDTNTTPWQAGTADGHSVMPLFQNEHETVTLEKLPPGVNLEVGKKTGGVEILVLEGRLTVNGKTYSSQSWLRLPPDSKIALSSTQGCTFWIKRGHLVVDNIE